MTRKRCRLKNTIKNYITINTNFQKKGETWLAKYLWAKSWALINSVKIKKNFCYLLDLRLELNCYYLRSVSF